MTLALTLVGAALVGLALRDIFHTVFHPQGSGSLSGWVQRATWWGSVQSSRVVPRILSIAGPMAVVATVVTWTLSLTLGWALIFWPRLPDEFLLASGLVPDEQAQFSDAFYLALTTLATLGFGDLTPTSGWLRVAMPIVALLGFVILTATISWILSIYPVLSRRRGLARRMTLLRDAESATGVAFWDQQPPVVAALLSDIADRVVTVSGDLTQYPITFYFASDDDESSFPEALPILDRLSREARSDTRAPEIRLQGEILGGAFADLIAVLRPMVLRGRDDAGSAPVNELYETYRREHRAA